MMGLTKKTQLYISILLLLGTSLVFGQQDFEKIKINAEKGDSLAQFELARKYDDGEGTDIDKKKAFYWYLKSAEKGYLFAMPFVGAKYLIGEGTKKDKKKAYYWLQKAANKINAYIVLERNKEALYSLLKYVYIFLSEFTDFNEGDIATTKTGLLFKVYSNSYRRISYRSIIFTVLVYIENFSNESKSYNIFNCSLKDDNGFKYEPQYFTEYQQSLTAGILSPHEFIRGFVSFEIPYNARGLKFIYSSSFWNNKIVIHLNY